jgi:hypothetical protein
MPADQFVDVDLNPGATQDGNPPTPAATNPDSFADDLFAPLDLRPGATFADELGEIANEEQPPVLPDTQFAPAPPAPVPTAPPQPEVIQYDDGSTLSVEKTNKGWRASLDSGVGNPENFYGKTKEEMWTNVASAKMHATRKINELNRKVKLSVRPQVTAEQPQQPMAQARALTSDEVAEVAQQLKSDPSLAFDTYFQKRTGMPIDQLVNLANDGRLARQELEAEAVAQAFKARHPEYQVVEANYQAMLGWLAKYKLGRTFTDANQQEIITTLYNRGLWNVNNLDEAYEDLTQDGFLELDLAPLDEDETEVDAPAVPQPAPPAPNPRIANVRVGQRAGLGIRQREATPTRQPDATRPPSDEEFDRMSDAEIAAQFAAVRRYASQTRR